MDDVRLYLDQMQENKVDPPFPRPDLPEPKRNTSAWSRYSDAPLQDFYAEILGAAIESYYDLAKTSFAGFAWSIGHRSENSEFGVLCSLTFSNNASFGENMPVLAYAIVPRVILKNFLQLGHTGVKMSSNKKALVVLNYDKSKLFDWISFAVRENAVKEGSSFSQYRNIVFREEVGEAASLTRPSSGIVAQWINSDLLESGAALSPIYRIQDIRVAE